MLILAADTSGKYGSIALAQCEAQDDCRILQVVPLAGGTFSAQLIPQISDLLQTHGFTKLDIDGFAVASGPGSFTGLRVGLAAIKALAEILQKPIATVSILEAVADAAKVPGKVLAVADAGRGEVYVGEYEASRLTDFGERLLRVEELVAEAKKGTVATPDGNIAAAVRAGGLVVKEVERPQGDAIARLGYAKTCSGNVVTVMDLEANYIRRSDAEIFSKPRLESN